MTIDMSQFYQVFFDEATEHLASMESLLVALDVNAPAMEDLNAIFRAAHSMKGGSGTFGFNDMTEVTHELETLLDRLRKEELKLTPAMVDAFLRAGDVIKGQLNAHRGEGAADPAAAAEIRATLKALTSGSAPAADDPVSVAPAAAATLAIEFTPVNPRFKPDELFANLQALGALEVAARPGASAGKRRSKRRKATGAPWRLALATAAPLGKVRELFEFVCAPDQLTIAPASATAIAATTPAPAAAAAVSDAGYGFFADAQPAPAAADPGYGFFAEPAPALAAEPPRTHGRRATDDPGVTTAVAGRRPSDKIAVAAHAEASSIRVNTEKVDQMINLVGELVVTQAMLAQSASALDPVVYEKLLNGLAQLDRNTRDLQDAVMSIRMMPMSFVFGRFPRVVRDVAAKLGKEIELKTEGESTELDKGVIEKIADPLTHLIRNSIDHGIETPETRTAAGKVAKGTVTLRAFHQGGNIIIEVADDGAGLNREKILAKARERGMTVSDAMSDQEVWQLIFEAGFSTAAVVTDVSGRGVGMDVVKNNIQKLNGRIEIESTPGVGTTINIALPLTLAILPVLIVRYGAQPFAVPLAMVHEIALLDPAQVQLVSGRTTMVIRDEVLPVRSLAKLLGWRSQAAPRYGVLMQSVTTKFVLAVDGFVGREDVVIKPLQDIKPKGVAGARLAGDSSVVLVLDIEELLAAPHEETRAMLLAQAA